MCHTQIDACCRYERPDPDSYAQCSSIIERLVAGQPPQLWSGDERAIRAERYFFLVGRSEPQIWKRGWKYCAQDRLLATRSSQEGNDLYSLHPAPIPPLPAPIRPLTSFCHVSSSSTLSRVTGWTDERCFKATSISFRHSKMPISRP